MRQRAAASGFWTNSRRNARTAASWTSAGLKVPGMISLLGIDNDPDAVRIAAENAAANGVAAKFSVCDLAVCRERAPVVVANVLAPVLTQFAAQVSACVERVPGNALILSGILDTQYPAVRAAYEAQGAVERGTVLAGEWRSGLFAF